MATTQALDLFDTPIGRCGMVWGARGLLGIQLPERGEDATRDRLLRRFPDAVEPVSCPEVEDAQVRIVAFLRGERSDLSTIALDMRRVPALHRRVYDAARAIPAGTTTTYGELAARIGEPGSARAVGRALGGNPFALVVPCHRVLAARGIGGFSGAGGVLTKRRLLAIEGALGVQHPLQAAGPTLLDVLEDAHGGVPRWARA